MAGRGREWKWEGKMRLRCLVAFVIWVIASPAAAEEIRVIGFNADHRVAHGKIPDSQWRLRALCGPPSVIRPMRKIDWFLCQSMVIADTDRIRRLSKTQFFRRQIFPFRTPLALQILRPHVCLPSLHEASSLFQYRDFVLRAKWRPRTPQPDQRPRPRNSPLPVSHRDTQCSAFDR